MVKRKKHLKELALARKRRNGGDAPDPDYVPDRAEEDEEIERVATTDQTKEAGAASKRQRDAGYKYRARGSDSEVWARWREVWKRGRPQRFQPRLFWRRRLANSSTRW